jgi:hypothetical protein
MEKDGEQLRQFLKFVRFLGPALRRADEDTNATVDTGAETTTQSEDTADPHRGKRGRELEPESSNSKRSKPSQHLQENTSEDRSVHDVHVSELAPFSSNPPVADNISPHSPQPPAISPQRHGVSGRSIGTLSAVPQPLSATPSASRNPPDTDKKSPQLSPRPQDVPHDASVRSVTSSAASQPSSREAARAETARAEAARAREAARASFRSFVRETLSR